MSLREISRPRNGCLSEEHRKFAGRAEAASGDVHIVGCGVEAKVGQPREDPIEHIDLAASSLALAGVARPSWMQSRDILAKNYIPRRYAVSAQSSRIIR